MRGGAQVTTTLISSYPKSGNTWVRAIVSALRGPACEDLDINRLGDDACASLDFIERFTSCDPQVLSAQECLPLRRLALQRARTFAESNGMIVLKSHDANSPVAGERLFDASSVGRCIYLVRSPFDVAISYAHHSALPVDAVIAHMGDPRASMEDHMPATRVRDGRTAGLAPQLLGSWSEHVAGFLDNFEGALLVYRYEDLCRDPHEGVARIAAFLELDADPTKIDWIRRQTDFARLAEQESTRGFQGKPSAAQRFFRAGRQGEGARLLSPVQRDRILADHGAMMERLGYVSSPDTQPSS